MDYTRYRDIANRLIPKYGTSGTLENTRVVPDPDKPWNSTPVTTTTAISLIAFPDDGHTFVDHNISGDVRIIMVAPKPTLSIEIGDKIKYGVNAVTVQKLKKLDPDGSGAILWAALVL